MADAFVVFAEDAFVFPFGGGGGERLGVDLAGAGVDGEEHEAGAAIDVDFDAVHLAGETVPSPAEADMAAADAEGNDGFKGGGICAGGFVAAKAESFADVLGVAGEGAQPLGSETFGSE